MSAPDRRAKLDRDHPHLSVRRQCAMLGIARSGVYRSGCAANDNDLALLRRIDELFTRWPFLGSRRMTAMLRAEVPVTPWSRTAARAPSSRRCLVSLTIILRPPVNPAILRPPVKPRRLKPGGL